MSHNKVALVLDTVRGTFNREKVYLIISTGHVIHLCRMCQNYCRLLKLRIYKRLDFVPLLTQTCLKGSLMKSYFLVFLIYSNFGYKDLYIQSRILLYPNDKSLYTTVAK